MEKCYNNRSRGMPRPHPYASGNPAKTLRSKFCGISKGKSSLLIYQKYANMKCKYKNREFWCRGYYIDTVGKNTEKIKEYIANQLKEYKLAEQMSITEIIDPFKA